MIPFKTDAELIRHPVMTWVIIALNVAVFALMRPNDPEAFENSVLRFAAVPRNVVGSRVTFVRFDGATIAAIGRDGHVLPESTRLPAGIVRDIEAEYRAHPAGPLHVEVSTLARDPIWGDRRPQLTALAITTVTQPIPGWLTLFTSMFMHAGWLHLLGNMWFFFVFGAAIEDVLGTPRFIAFYLLTGLAASAGHILSAPGSLAPCLGASGAISGVMGAFAMVFPRANVRVFWWWLLSARVFNVPALIYLFFYLGDQILNSLLYADTTGGVAWWAHIVGFAAGYLGIRLFRFTDDWAQWFETLRSRAGPPISLWNGRQSGF